MRVAFRFNDRRLIGRLVAWWQRSDTSHCEIVVESLGSAFRCASASWVDGGVRYMVNDLPASKWRLYEIDSGNVEAAKAWMQRHAGAKYDWLGLLGFVVRPATAGKSGRWWCSEACAAMLGLNEPWRYCVADLENACRLIGRQVQ